MASFKDKLGNLWSVNFDPILLGEIKSQLGVNLVDLNNDPLEQLVEDPEKLWAVVQMVCQEQYEAKGMSAEQFAKVLIYPPDEMFSALRNAVIDFFPSGRASHVRDRFVKFDQISQKSCELSIAKMQQAIDDPRMTQAMSEMANKAITDAIEKLTMGQSVGT